MKKLLSIVAFAALSWLPMAAQSPAQTTTDSRPSAQTPSSNPDTSVPQTQADTSSAQPSAHAFEGKIEKLNGELVLQENTTKASYKLDDQDKAKKFEGQDVKILATLDPSTNNKLHVVDITRVETE